MQNDVDRLIDIAGQLFGAIERQLHSIEHDLDDAPSEPSEASDQWVFKEQLMRTASSLHASLNEIAVHLGGQARGTLSPPDLVE